MNREKTVRSITKAITWRLIASVATFLIAWHITKEIEASVVVGTSDMVIKIALYFFHERIWNKINWGKQNEFVE